MQSFDNQITVKINFLQRGKKMKAIINSNTVLENGILWDSVIIIEDGKIASVKNKREAVIPENAEIIDAKGAYVGPGFVDIHVHGGGGYLTHTDVEKASEFFLKHGTTSILATPVYHMDKARMISSIRAIKQAMDSGAAKTVRGIYSEGPYTNCKYGSHADTNPWRNGVKAEDYVDIVNEAGDYVKVWTVAPEREELMPFLEYAKKVNPNVIFSVGHSDATPAQVRSMGKYKPKILTHAMCATKRQPVYGGTRGSGIDEYCLCEPDMYAELISDSCGIHVNSELQRMLVRNKGIDRIILITDSTVHNNPVPDNLKHVKDLNFDPNGGIAGSKLTMDLACRNIMTHTNCGIAQAFYMAATTPARAIGMDDEIGSIVAGKKADLVFVDDRFNIKRVMLNGGIVNE